MATAPDAALSGVSSAVDRTPAASGDDGDDQAPSLHVTGTSGDESFTATVTAVAAAFGDPTRRDIYLFVRANPGTTASEAASAFSLHPNVARHHLDRLAAGGYLSVETERRPGEAGRPSKRFFPQGDDPTLGFLNRRDDLMGRLLREAMEMLGPEQAEVMAAKVGEEYGRMLAAKMSPVEGQRSVRAAMHAIAETLTAHGFSAHAEDRGSTTAVVAEHCPFGGGATTNPVLCAVDRGMVEGLLSGLCGSEPESAQPVVVVSSRARGDDTCGALA